MATMQVKLSLAFTNTGYQDNQIKLFTVGYSEYGNVVRSIHTVQFFQREAGGVRWVSSGNFSNFKSNEVGQAKRNTEIFAWVDKWVKGSHSGKFETPETTIIYVTEAVTYDTNIPWSKFVENILTQELTKDFIVNGQLVAPKDAPQGSLALNAFRNLSALGLSFCKTVNPKADTWIHNSFDTVVTAPTATGQFIMPTNQIEYCLDVEKSVVRPNGEHYYTRTIMGHIDVALLRKFRATEQYVQLVGPPGAGKTSLAEAAFGAELLTVNGHGDITVPNFVGSYIPNRNKSEGEPDWVWVDGPLTIAMKEGRPLLIDEATRIPTDALDIVISATDGRRTLTLDERPDAPVVVAKEGFYVIMSYNPETLMGRQLDPAIRSRFGVSINVETDFSSVEKMGIPEMAVKLAIRLDKKNKELIASGGRGIWVPQMRELLQYKKIVDNKLGEEFAWNNLYAQCPELHKDTMHAEIASVMKSAPKVPSLEKIV